MLSAAALIEQVAKASGLKDPMPKNAPPPFISTQFQGFAPKLYSFIPLNEVEEQNHSSSEMTCWEFPCLWWDSVGHEPESVEPLYPHLLHFPHLSSVAAQPWQSAWKAARQPEASGRFFKGPGRLPSIE